MERPYVNQRRWKSRASQRNFRSRVPPFWTDAETLARQSWRWRILYLRALLDKELKRSTGHPTERAEEAFRELIDIYHASQADTPVKPPF